MLSDMFLYLFTGSFSGAEGGRGRFEIDDSFADPVLDVFDKLRRVGLSNGPEGYTCRKGGGDVRKEVSRTGSQSGAPVKPDPFQLLLQGRHIQSLQADGCELSTRVSDSVIDVKTDNGSLKHNRKARRLIKHVQSSVSRCLFNSSLMQDSNHKIMWDKASCLSKTNDTEDQRTENDDNSEDDDDFEFIFDGRVVDVLNEATRLAEQELAASLDEGVPRQLTTGMNLDTSEHGSNKFGSCLENVDDEFLDDGEYLDDDKVYMKNDGKGIMVINVGSSFEKEGQQNTDETNSNGAEWWNFVRKPVVVPSRGGADYDRTTQTTPDN